MANDIKVSQGGITITFDGTTAWDAATLFPDGILLDSLEHVVLSPTSTMQVRAETATGRVLFRNEGSTILENKMKYFNADNRRKRKLYVVGNEVSNGAMLIIEFR